MLRRAAAVGSSLVVLSLLSCPTAGSASESSGVPRVDGASHAVGVTFAHGILVNDESSTDPSNSRFLEISFAK
jgi:hypothetical protein